MTVEHNQTEVLTTGLTVKPYLVSYPNVAICGFFARKGMLEAKTFLSDKNVRPTIKLLDGLGKTNMTHV